MNNKLKKQKYVVYVNYDYDFGCENHCILKCTDLQTAKSIKRHFDKILYWDDYTQTGFYCGFVSRKYCTNFDYFTRETFSKITHEQFEYYLNGGNVK